MALHKISLSKEIADKVLYENKKYDICIDDNFCIGDKVIYICKDENGQDIEHRITTVIFDITSVEKECEGLQKGYVAFSLRRS